jgi:hypothetical protein
MDDAPTNQQRRSRTKKRACQEVERKDRTERSHAHCVATDHRGPSSEERGRGGRTPDTKGKVEEKSCRQDRRPRAMPERSIKLGSKTKEACADGCLEQHHAASEEQAGSGSHGRVC